MEDNPMQAKGHGCCGYGTGYTNGTATCRNSQTLSYASSATQGEKGRQGQTV